MRACAARELPLRAGDRKRSAGRLTSRLKMSSTRPRRGERRDESGSPSSLTLTIVLRSGTGVARVLPSPPCDPPERPRHMRVRNRESAAQPDRLRCMERDLYRACRLICPATLDAASFELHGICRAKIADRKASPHDGGMTALASGSGSSPVPSVSALVSRTTSRSSARPLPAPCRRSRSPS
jgi:hypothetical protein